MKNLLLWFKVILLIANPGKFPFKILGNKMRYKHSLNIGSITIKESGEVEFLAITFNKALIFKKYVKNLFVIKKS